VERRGHPVQGGAGRRRARPRRRARLPAPGGACGVRDLRRDPCALGVRAERAGAGLRPLPLQAGLAGRVAGPAGRRPGGGGRLRGHEHRAHRRRRVRPRGLRRPDPRHPAGAGGPGRAGGARAARRRAGPLAGRAGVHLLGLPGRHVPPRPGDADRPGAGLGAGGRPGAGGLGGPPGPQGQRAERPRPGDRRPGRGARRRPGSPSRGQGRSRPRRCSLRRYQPWPGSKARPGSEASSRRTVASIRP
jgi:translation initiation factor IF-2